MTEKPWEEKWFKVLSDRGMAMHGGYAQWRLPEGDQPGAWMPPISGDIQPCYNGYHLAGWNDLKRWMGATIYEAEWRGESVTAHEKIAVREARLIRQLPWTQEMAKLLSCDYAQRVLPLYETVTGDGTVRKHLQVIKAHLEGTDTSDLYSLKRALYAIEENLANHTFSSRNAVAFQAVVSVEYVLIFSVWAGINSYAETAITYAEDAGLITDPEKEHAWFSERLMRYLYDMVDPMEEIGVIHDRT